MRKTDRKKRKRGRQYRESHIEIDRKMETEI